MNNFDWKTYVNNYIDLQKAGINTEQKALRHYIMYGIKEGRSYLNLTNITQTYFDNNIKTEPVPAPVPIPEPIKHILKQINIFNTIKIIKQNFDENIDEIYNE